ncbi:MAG: hypothetical protein IJO57_04470 [Bacilli bacterium]|nr:hypothetical protein [Bacilli bacterium]
MSKKKKVFIISLVLIFISFGVFTIILYNNYSTLLDRNKSLNNEVNKLNNDINKLIDSNEEIKNNIDKIKIDNKDKVEEYEVWVKMKKKLVSALS